jgi:hypothetical protein
MMSVYPLNVDSTKGREKKGGEGEIPLARVGVHPRELEFEKVSL